MLLVQALAAPVSVGAQPRTPPDADREQAYVDELRREDAPTAERYVRLRDARAQAIAELRKVETQYNGAGPELRGLFIGALQQARRTYAETSLALLEFYDGRDRAIIGRYQEAIGKINATLEQRRKTREELEKLLGR